MSRIRGTFLGAGLLLFAVGCGGGGAATPDAAFKDFQAAVKAKDGDKAWNLMSKEAQTQMDQLADFAKKMTLGMLEKLPKDAFKAAEDDFTKKSGMSFADFKKMDGKTMLKMGLTKGGKESEGLGKLVDATLENVKVEGDKATATMKTGKDSAPLTFAKEGGSWKITPPAK